MEAAFKHKLINFKALTPQRKKLEADYIRLRRLSESLCLPLGLEDYNVQSMDDVSPPKWHLAHSTWFFETFILSKAFHNFKLFHPEFNYLFNSYYKGIGKHYPRARRGLIFRPTTLEVYDYRRYVDEHMQIFFNNASPSEWNEFGNIIELGIHHEQQHQELLMMDILHNFSFNSLKPTYLKEQNPSHKAPPIPLKWFEFSEDLYEIGSNGEEFCFDNESPRHRIFLESFRFASRLVTNAEYLEFMEDQAYSKPLLWLSDAWELQQKAEWSAPLYWEMHEGEWWSMTLRGFQKLDLNAPVCHLSYYEADAYAHWAGKRLPSEGEWEIVAGEQVGEGIFLESRFFRPQALQVESNNQVSQLWGDCWEWTQSPYMPYPRFKPFKGDLGEYNGKFMSNQMVLRGGSCVSPEGHLRPSYRNFFPPWSRWQFSGIRLAEDS